MAGSEKVKARIKGVRRRKQSRKVFACETLEKKIRIVQRKRRGER